LKFLKTNFILNFKGEVEEPEPKHGRKKVSHDHEIEDIDGLSELDAPGPTNKRRSKFRHSDQNTDLKPEKVLNEELSSDLLSNDENEEKGLRRPTTRSLDEEINGENEEAEIFKPKKLEGFRLSDSLSMGREISDDPPEKKLNKKRSYTPLKADEFPMDDEEKNNINYIKVKSILEKDNSKIKGPLKRPSHLEESAEPIFPSSENKIDEILNKHKMLLLNPQGEEEQNEDTEESDEKEGEELDKPDMSDETPTKKINLIEESEEEIPKTIKKFKPLKLNEYDSEFEVKKRKSKEINNEEEEEIELEETTKTIKRFKPLHDEEEETDDNLQLEQVLTKKQDKIYDEENVEKMQSEERTIKKFKPLHLEEAETVGDDEDMEKRKPLVKNQKQSQEEIQLDEPKIKRFKPLDDEQDLIERQENKVKKQIISLEEEESLKAGDSDLDSLIKSNEESLKKEEEKPKNDQDIKKLNFKEIIGKTEAEDVREEGFDDLDEIEIDDEDLEKETKKQQKNKINVNEDLFKPKLLKLEETVSNGKKEKKENSKKIEKVVAETEETGSEKPYPQEIMNDLLNFEAQTRSNFI